MRVKTKSQRQRAKLRQFRLKPRHHSIKRLRNEKAKKQRMQKDVRLRNLRSRQKKN